jgi:O-antigen ligase
MIPLLVFASRGGFSFEHGSVNTAIGARVGDTNDSAPMKIQSSIVYLICGCIIMRFSRTIFPEFGRDLLISSLLVLALFSTLWSELPSKTFLHAMMLCTSVAIAFYLVRHFSSNDLMKLFLAVGVLAAVGSMLLVVILPQYGLQERNSVTSGSWEGIFPQKNICGLMMTELTLPAFFIQFKSHYAKMLRNLYVFLALAIVAMSHSAGAWVICAACVIFVATIRALVRMPRKDVLAIVFVLMGFATIAGLLIYSNFDTLMYALGKDPTLTGRTAIWASLIPSVAKRPLLGYGFTAFWLPLMGESANTQLFMHWPGMGYAENGVLELWLELGAVGVLLYLLVYLRAIRDAFCCFKRKPPPVVMWYISLLFFLTISNIEGGALLSTSDLDVVLSLIAVIGLRREAQRDLTHPQHISWKLPRLTGRHGAAITNRGIGTAEAS